MELHLDAERRQASIFELEQYIEKKHLVPRASRLEIIASQIRFMEKKMIVLQLICFMLLAAVYVGFRGRLEEKDLYLLGTAASACFSMFLAVACMQEETRGIAETAGSCFFNNRQLFTLKMILYGIFDISCLGAVMLEIGENTHRSLLEVGIYVAVPFMVTGCLQFGIMLTGIGRNSVYAMAAGGVCMAVLCGMAVSYGRIYERGSLGVWLLALLVSGAVYGWEIIWMLQRMDRGELLCMN